MPLVLAPVQDEDFFNFIDAAFNVFYTLEAREALEIALEFVEGVVFAGRPNLFWQWARYAIKQSWLELRDHLQAAVTERSRS